MKRIIWDEYGMILQTGDGGDSAANIGTYHVYLETRRRMGHTMFNDGPWPCSDVNYFAAALAALESPEVKGLGLYRRHPNKFSWGSRTNTMSRDQTIPLLSAMALYGLRGKVWQYVKGHARRGFLFTTNTTPNWTYPSHQVEFTMWEKIKFFFGWDAGYPVYRTKLPDVTFGDFWALELRGLYHPWLWPVFFPILCALDAFTLAGSFAKIYVYAKDPTNSDDRNHINVMLVGLQICATPVIRFAAKVYSKRPRAELVGPEIWWLPSGPQAALDHYYRAVNSPPFNELAAPIVKQYFE